MKYILIPLAFIFLIIGSIGIIVPILPTTPFYLLSLFLFSKSSKNYENWFKNTKIYKRNIKTFHESRTLNIKTKISILTFTTTLITLAMIICSNIYITIILINILCIKYYYFIFKIKTK
ncbi:MAG TPA: DUF454 domain-containing protein [Mollicutes bacterium]|nr:DUF454 domain-containing protein [Mollicutes bacterium]